MIARPRGSPAKPRPDSLVRLMGRFLPTDALPKLVQAMALAHQHFGCVKETDALLCILDEFIATYGTRKDRGA